MRPIILLTAALSFPSACASVPDLTSEQCRRANETTLAGRISDPCGYSDALAECIGVPADARKELYTKCLERLSAPAPVAPTPAPAAPAVAPTSDATASIVE